jgi:hypothetical protein
VRALASNLHPKKYYNESFKRHPFEKKIQKLKKGKNNELMAAKKKQ